LDSAKQAHVLDLQHRQIGVGGGAHIGVAHLFAAADRGGGAGLDHRAAVQHDDMVAQVQHQPDIVFDQQNAAAHFARDAADQRRQVGGLGKRSSRRRVRPAARICRLAPSAPGRSPTRRSSV
jgi:hypothetical protein